MISRRHFFGMTAGLASAGWAEAQDAQHDLSYQMLQKGKNPGRSFDPAYLTQTKFYPAIYYAPCSAKGEEHYPPCGADAALKRLNAFLQHSRTACPVVWQTDLGGAKLWVSTL